LGDQKGGLSGIGTTAGREGKGKGRKSPAAKGRADKALGRGPTLGEPVRFGVGRARRRIHGVGRGGPGPGPLGGACGRGETTARGQAASTLFHSELGGGERVDENKNCRKTAGGTTVGGAGT